MAAVSTKYDVCISAMTLPLPISEAEMEALIRTMKEMLGSLRTARSVVVAPTARAATATTTVAIAPTDGAAAKQVAGKCGVTMKNGKPCTNASNPDKSDHGRCGMAAHANVPAY